MRFQFEKIKSLCNAQMVGITEADLLLIARIVEEGEDDEFIKCVVNLEMMLARRRQCIITNKQPVDSSPPSLTFTTYGGKSCAFDGTDSYLSSEGNDDDDDDGQQSSFVAAAMDSSSPLALYASISSSNNAHKKRIDTKRRKRTPKQRQIRSIVATSIGEPSSSPSPPFISSSADETPPSPDSAISAMRRLFDEIGSQDLVLCPRDDEDGLLKPQRRLKKMKGLIVDSNAALPIDVTVAPTTTKASWPKRGGKKQV